MRKMILALTIYLTHALAPPFTPPFTPPSVTEAAAKFIKLGVSAAPRGSQTVNRRKRKRVKRVMHRKPPTVYVYPDVILPMSYAEFWVEQRKSEAAALAMWAMLKV